MDPSEKNRDDACRIGGGEGFWIGRTTAVLSGVMDGPGGTEASRPSAIDVIRETKGDLSALRTSVVYSGAPVGEPLLYALKARRSAICCARSVFAAPTLLIS
ncbi:MAG: hypothetical protein NVS4B5_21410 [Vulcanimicrobiaceae bacterium]